MPVQSVLIRLGAKFPNASGRPFTVTSPSNGFLVLGNMRPRLVARNWDMFKKAKRFRPKRNEFLTRAFEFRCCILLRFCSKWENAFAFS